MYSPRCMMIGKALLSGFWVCPECLSLARSTPFLTLASIEVFYDCELLCLDGSLYVISGILARGIPGFRIVLCCFTHSTVWQCVFCVFVFSFVLFLPYQYLSWYNAITSPSSLVSELDRRSLSTLLVFWVFCLVCLVFVLFFVAFGVVWLFAVFLQWIVTAAGLCTGPIPVHFCGPHTWWRLFVCIN